VNLKSRLARIEKFAPIVDEVHFMGWADCEWKEAEGLVRANDESKESFFDRVRAVTNKKWVWCD
jgi:hypothetical protein